MDAESLSLQKGIVRGDTPSMALLSPVNDSFNSVRAMAGIEDSHENGRDDSFDSGRATADIGGSHENVR
jgi:hypothetical protein